MLNFEKKLFENLMNCVDSSDKEVGEILNGEKENKKMNWLYLSKI